MNEPKVSVIIPIGDDSSQLFSCLDSLLAQTYQDFEIICINHGVQTETLQLLKKYIEKDNRIQLSQNVCTCAGSAADQGIDLATGRYILFLQPGDIVETNLLQIAVPRAETVDADMIVFNGYYMREMNLKDTTDGYDAKVILDAGTVFSRLDYPNNILNLIPGGIQHRLIRRSLLRDNNIHFPALASQWDVPVCALCDVLAQRITVTGWRLINKTGITSFIAQDVLSVIDILTKQLFSLPFAEELQRTIMHRVLEYATSAFRGVTADFSSDNAKNLYLSLQKLFQSELFLNLNRTLFPTHLICFFDTILHTSYEQMLLRCSKEIVVSFTSFPGRIHFACNVISNIKHQTKPADKFFLYLAPEQFPKLEGDLPQELQDQISEGLVQLQWCPDIRSHKKYHYVMQEHPDSLIITLDDDLTYPNNMLQKLFDCYLCFPEEISAMRAHLIVTDAAAEQVLPYNRWVKEYREHTYMPSSQLFVTSGAGTLFPPNVLHPMTFDIENARKMCPYADDIWLNIMALINGKKVVLATDDFTMQCLPGSQEEALQSINVDNNQNDIQFEHTRNWLKQTFGEDILWKALTSGAAKISCQTVWELSDQYLALDEERKRIQSKLHRVWKDKVNRENDAKRYREDIAKLNSRLAKVQKELEDELRSFRILRKFRNAYRCYRTNGVKYTLSLGTQKIARKLRDK